MPDLVGPIAMLEYDRINTTASCPRCAAEFHPKRSNQRFCTRACQKASSDHTARGPRTKENKAMNYRHYERASRLAEMVYTAAPNERLGIIKHILSFVDQDAGLRRVLTDPKLMTEPPRADNKMNIAQTASAYTKKFFGVSIGTYLKQVRSGNQPAFQEVPAQVDLGSAPRLRTIKAARCWHRPLSSKPVELSQAQFEQDMLRVSEIVEHAQANTYHSICGQFQAAA